MIEVFDGKRLMSSKFGNKAKSLILMRKAGFNVPNGFVLDSDSFDDFLRDSGIEKTLKKDLEQGKLSKKTLAQFDSAEFSKEVLAEIEQQKEKKKRYAVRSSCTKEDLGNLSFAGQYESFLFVEPKNVARKIIECYRATYNDNIVA